MNPPAVFLLSRKMAGGLLLGLKFESFTLFCPGRY